MRGIAFCNEMVRAILNTEFDRYPAVPLDDPAGPVKCQTRRMHDHVHYHVGDVYVVKETLKGRKYGAIYESDQSPVLGKDGFQVPWRWNNIRLPSIFMPDFAGRCWVEIVKVERSTLGVMGVMDLVYEGLLVTNEQMDQLYGDWGAGEEEKEYRIRWKNLWESLNGNGSFKPDKEIMVYHFKRVRKPES